MIYNSKTNYKPNLNVLTYGYFDRFNFHCVFHNIKQFFKNIKYAWQRTTRGYCDQDIWDLFDFYTELMISTITQLKENHVGFPGNDEFSTDESWEEYLQEIIDHLIKSREDTDNKYTFLSNNVRELIDTNPNMDKDSTYDTYLNLLHKEWEERESEKDKALEMISHCWYNLWD